MTNLANAYGELGSFKTKTALLERALEIQIRYYGSDHPETAVTMTNLASAYGELGKYNDER